MLAKFWVVRWTELELENLLWLALSQLALSQLAPQRLALLLLSPLSLEQL